MITGNTDWRAFIRRHWRAIPVFAAAAALVLVWSVIVFLWFVGVAQSSGMVPGILGLWTMGDLLTFILYVIGWELLLVGVPVAIAAIAGWVWWKRLGEDERMWFHSRGRRRTAGGSGGVSLFLFIAFFIKVFLDGKWNVAIGTFTIDYVVGSVVTILLWTAVIFGIPAAIGLTWWLNHEMKKP